VPLYFTTLPPVVPYIQNGKLRALAVTSEKRSQFFPDVPAFNETPALKGFVLDIHYGLWVPANTPRDIIQRLNAEVARALNAPEVRERLRSLGAEEIAGSTPEQLDALVKAETPVWSRVIKAAGIKSEEFR